MAGGLRVVWQASCEAPEREDAVGFSLGTELTQLLQRPPVTFGRLFPDQLEAIAEVDHYSQHLVAVEQLVQLLAILRVQQLWMTNEQLRGAWGEKRGTLVLRQLSKNRPYDSTAVFTQHVQAVREQRFHGVRIYIHMIPHHVWQRRQGADAREAQRAQHTDE